MKRILWLAVALTVLALPMWGQVTNPGIRYVATAPSGSCPAHALPVQVSYSNEICTCGAGTWSCNSGGGGTTPGGTAGQIQWNNADAFAGAGLTDGTHLAFGDGAALNNVPAPSPDTIFSFSPKVIAAFEETYTGADYENGLYVNLNLNPSSASTGNSPVGFYTRVVANDSANYGSEALSNVFGSVISATSNIDSPNVGPNTGFTGLLAGAYASGTAHLSQLIGQASDAVVNPGAGPVDQIESYYAAYLNESANTVGLAIGMELSFQASGGGATTELNQIQVDSPATDGESTIGLIRGIDVQAQCDSGSPSECYEAQFEGTGEVEIDGFLTVANELHTSGAVVFDGVTGAGTLGPACLATDGTISVGNNTGVGAPCS